jgi:uncharacterized protein YjiS (DUF1127 family)
MTALIMTADKIGLPGVANWFKNLSNKIQARRLEKQTYAELSKLSNRELQDMGISRSDIPSIARGTWEDNRAQTNANLKGWV